MILTALNNYYGRLVEQGNPDVPPYGYSPENISYCLVIDREGALIDVVSLLDTTEKKPRPSVYLVPQPPKRASNVAPCFLWDKSSYVLGLTSSEKDKDIHRARQTHEKFKEYHRHWLEGEDDVGLQALLAFLDRWDPEDEIFVNLVPIDALDTNLVFRLDEELVFLHQRDGAKAIRDRQLASPDQQTQTCLVTGELAPVAALHPTIKGVNGAQSSGASLVSFNLSAFESHGKKQGMNAPVSERAAFGYGTALNYLLRRDPKNRQRLQIGDSTVVFWAEAESPQEAEASEDFLGGLLLPPTNSEDLDNPEVELLHATLNKVAAGEPLQNLNLQLNPDTRIYILGLAPNAARLSVRFWEVDTLERFTQRIGEHYRDLLLQPAPWKKPPSIWRLLLETVPYRNGKSKSDDVAPHLAGELARAILTGRRYPRHLLTHMIMRMRADGHMSSLRVALCKAVLVRDQRLGSIKDKEIPVSLDIDNRDPGYVLGRLFATLESVQRAALGGKVNATIRDRYYGAASATPASVFPVLLRNAQSHFSKVRKEKPGLAVNLEKQTGAIMELLPAEFPKTLGLEEQGRFAIGYYHQRNEIFNKHAPDIQEGDTE
jgi:CRISPR-associated protein Csd1